MLNSTKTEPLRDHRLPLEAMATTDLSSIQQRPSICCSPAWHLQRCSQPHLLILQDITELPPFQMGPGLLTGRQKATLMLPYLGALCHLSHATWTPLRCGLPRNLKGLGSVSSASDRAETSRCPPSEERRRARCRRNQLTELPWSESSIS